MLIVFICVHSFLIALAIRAGLKVLCDLWNGQASCKRCVAFLRYSLAGNILGLVLPFDRQLLSVRLLSMICVYMSGMVALSWKGFHLRGLWRPVFVFSLTVVFGINVQIVLDYFFHGMLPFAGLPGSEAYALALASETAVAVAYTALAAVTTLRCRAREP